MPRRTRDRELARRRKRKEKRRKLRAKGGLGPPGEAAKEEHKKRPPKKVEVKGLPPETSKEVGEPTAPKTPEG